MASSAERLIWRLVRPTYAPGLDGEGARRAGGRWNSPGRPAVYAASTLSLAVLEAFVHLPAAQRAPGALPAMRMVCLEIPGRTIVAAPDDVEPEDIAAARACGDRWLDARQSLVLDVPSVVVPVERTLVINPLHPDMGKVRIVDERPFRFDRRLAGPGAR